MNRHFRDARYHAKRAGEELYRGIDMELEPVREMVAAYRGEEPEPERTRVDRIQSEVTGRAGEARRRVGEMRSRA
ncbi:DUF7553 family protein [Haloarchaeobius sp. HRN-SO-5]|uniref:DUF7553 family protein n=1 Tax=Haloarchaeobius sp. HRN-SO-5 TaxID=3446118 RepID=UPI003EB82116